MILKALWFTNLRFVIDFHYDDFIVQGALDSVYPIVTENINKIVGDTYYIVGVSSNAVAPISVQHQNSENISVISVNAIDIVLWATNPVYDRAVHATAPTTLCKEGR